MANNRIAYGIAKGMGINTDGMQPYQVWQLINERMTHSPDGNSVRTVNYKEDSSDSAFTTQDYKRKGKEINRKMADDIIKRFGKEAFDKDEPIEYPEATERCMVLRNLLSDEFGISGIRNIKWSGKVYVYHGMYRRYGAAAEKTWRCNINISSLEINDHVLIHELLHSASVAHCWESYEKHKNWEEGIVELFTREICKNSGLKSNSTAYEPLVNCLKFFNNKLKLYPDNLQFAKAYFSVDLDKRHDTFINEITDRCYQLKSNGKLTEELKAELTKNYQIFMEYNGG